MNQKKLTYSSGTNCDSSINKIFRIFFKIEIEHHESSRNNVPFMPLYFCNAGVSPKDSVSQIFSVASKYK